LNKKHLIILIAFWASASMSGNDFRLGVRIEFFSYSFEKFNNNNEYSTNLSLSSLPGFYIFYSRLLPNNTSILVKPGLFFSGDGKFNGFDIGGYLRKYFSSKNIYIYSGLNYLWLTIQQGGTRPPEIESNPFFINFGVGLNIDNHINIDIGYYHTLNKKIGTSYLGLYSENPQKKPFNLFNLIKLGIEFSL
jgi:hypothetical protein